jgi:hypothetical protein
LGAAAGSPQWRAQIEPRGDGVTASGGV